MEITVEMVERLREKAPVSYAQAKEDSRARHMTRAHSRAPRRFFKGHTSVSS